MEAEAGRKSPLDPDELLDAHEEEELEGLDLSEHGMHAYDLSGSPGFVDEQSHTVFGGGPAPASSKIATSET